ISGFLSQVSQHNMLAGTDTPSDGLADRSRANDYCYVCHLFLLKKGRAPLYGTDEALISQRYLPGPVNTIH
ncbi:hypothetical protein A249_27280, partial [Pseudomonas syringae pv. actinidiae ICMP 18804]